MATANTPVITLNRIQREAVREYMVEALEAEAEHLAAAMRCIRGEAGGDSQDARAGLSCSLQMIEGGLRLVNALDEDHEASDVAVDGHVAAAMRRVLIQVGENREARQEDGDPVSPEGRAYRALREHQEAKVLEVAKLAEVA